MEKREVALDRCNEAGPGYSLDPGQRKRPKVLQAFKWATAWAYGASIQPSHDDEQSLIIDDLLN
jgi:hypothetical protein